MIYFHPAGAPISTPSGVVYDQPGGNYRVRCNACDFDCEGAPTMEDALQLARDHGWLIRSQAIHGTAADPYPGGPHTRDFCPNCRIRPQHYVSPSFEDGWIIPDPEKGYP